MTEEGIDKALKWVKDNPVLFGSVGAAVLSLLFGGVKRFYSVLWSHVASVWQMRKTEWIPPEAHVRIHFPTRIKFNAPGSARLAVPREMGFEVTGKVRLIRRVTATGLPNPDFRINFRPRVGQFPYCYVICPWEGSERTATHFECHMNWTPSPSEGSGERLRQVELSRIRNMPFSYTFKLRVTAEEFCFKTSLGQNAEFRVPMSELSDRDFPLGPQYIEFHAINSVTRLTCLRIKSIRN